MATDRDGNDWGSTSPWVKIAVAMLFFFISIEAARNTFGFADKLSGLPGVSEGWNRLGFAAAVFVFGTAGVVAGGGIVAKRGDLPTIGGGSSSVDRQWLWRECAVRVLGARNAGQLFLP